MLQLFGEVSGLRINLHKSTIACIRCDEDLAAAVAGHFQCRRQAFPIQYLGLPLSIYKLKRQDLLPLIDKFSNKMKGWKPKMMAPAGRLTLVWFLWRCPFTSWRRCQCRHGRSRSSIDDVEVLSGRARRRSTEVTASCHGQGCVCLVSSVDWVS